MTRSPADQTSRVTVRFRLVACCLVLAAVAFSQRPGRLVSDTKLDLVVDPGGMLGRALHLWDPAGGFGQVQNQAYGYLFPMGPFFWLGDLLSLPGWVVQRLWWAMLLVVAFLGVVKLCGVLGVGSSQSRLVAGFAYALSPRILTTLGPISIEAWPSALAPWVLVPLVVGASRGSPRRAAALSALAVAAVGGVNAAATFAVIPLAALWLLTRERGPRRRSLMVWWPAFLVLGTAWWLVPLLLLGRFSPPFLDYIETSAVTTFPTTLFDALRGTSHWVPYVDQTWRAGNDLLSTGYVALDMAVLLVLGVAGVMSRSNVHRQYLVLALLLGLAMVTVGHGGAVEGWFAALERSALDGALAPLRNVHKFDPVIRLPLVVGLAHLVASWQRRTTTPSADDATRRTLRDVLSDGDRVAHAGVLILAVVAVAGAATPALTGRLAPADDFESVPTYWHRAVDWLGQNAGDTTSLLVPGSSFATYLWGNPEDEPIQALDGTAWAVRNAVPLAPPGNIRMLDSLERQWSSGQPSAGLAGYLARAGIGHLVVRNDLRGTGDLPDPVLIHQVLEGSPGITRVAAFGPMVGGPVRLDGRKEADRGKPGGARVVADDGWRARYRAVEIFEVAGAHRAVITRSPPVVVGGPEDLLNLMDGGLLGAEPAVLAVDADETAVPGRWLLTDGLRRREANFARIHDSKSATLVRGEDGRRGAPAREYALGDARWETHAEIVGARSVDASSARSFADTPGPVRPEYLPFAAFDGRPETAWRSGPPRGGDQPWVGIEFDRRREVRTVTVLTGAVGDAELRFRVETDAGSSKVLRVSGDEGVTATLPAGASSGLRLVGASAVPRELAIAEIQIPGVDVDRTLVLPKVPARWGAPSAIMLSSPRERDACVRVGGDTRCGTNRASDGEEAGLLDRTVRLGVGAAYELSATVRPVYGDALDGLMERDQFVSIRVSSTAVDDARASAIAAVDGDRGTTWVADPEDPSPTLSVRWIGKREVRGLRLRVDRQAAAAPPRRVELVYPGGSQTVELDRSGSAAVEPFRAERLEIRVSGKRRAVSQLPDGTTKPLGVGVSELRLDGLNLLPVELSTVAREIGCGFGPTLRIGTQLYATSVIASPRELFDGGSLPARVCGPTSVDLSPARTRVVMAPAPAFAPVRIVMTRPGETPLASVVPVELDARSPVVRRLALPSSTGERVVVVRENENDGWQATVHEGQAPRSVTVDGWQQAWQVSDGDEEVTLTYSPDGFYRLALLGGWAGLLLLAGAVALVRDRGPESAPLDPRRIPPWAVLLTGVVALGLIAGWWGMACAAVGAFVTVLSRRWFAAETVAWAAGLPLITAAGVYTLRPLGSAEGWAGALAAPQLFVAFTLGALVASDLDPPTRRFLQRRHGRSTSL